MATTLYTRSASGNLGDVVGDRPHRGTPVEPDCRCGAASVKLGRLHEPTHPSLNDCCKTVPVDLNSIASVIRDHLVEIGAIGWSVEISHSSDNIDLTLTHPASNGLVLELPADLDDPASEALRWVGATNEIRIASAAPPLTHQDMVMGVRSLASAFDWSSAEVNSIAALLESHGVLADDESAWLRAWLGIG